MAPPGPKAQQPTSSRLSSAGPSTSAAAARSRQEEIRDLVDFDWDDVEIISPPKKKPESNTAPKPVQPQPPQQPSSSRPGQATAANMGLQLPQPSSHTGELQAPAANVPSFNISIINTGGGGPGYPSFAPFYGYGAPPGYGFPGGYGGAVPFMPAQPAAQPGIGVAPGYPGYPAPYAAAPFMPAPQLPSAGQPGVGLPPGYLYPPPYAPWPPGGLPGAGWPLNQPHQPPQQHSTGAPAAGLAQRRSALIDEDDD